MREGETEDYSVFEPSSPNSNTLHPTPSPPALNPLRSQARNGLLPAQQPPPRHPGNAMLPPGLDAGRRGQETGSGDGVRRRGQETGSGDGVRRRISYSRLFVFPRINPSFCLLDLRHPFVPCLSPLKQAALPWGAPERPERVVDCSGAPEVPSAGPCPFLPSQVARLAAGREFAVAC